MNEIHHKPKYFQYIIGIVVAIIAIILIASIFDQGSSPALPTSQEVIDQETRTTEAVNYEYILPEDWEYYENAIEDIQGLQEDQVIQFGIVQDPLETNYMFFASSAKTGDHETLISFYKYNENDYSFERLWRQTYNTIEMGQARDMEEYSPEFHIIGYENGRLITLMQSSDDSPGPCSNPWLMGWEDRTGRNMMTIDLSDPYAGFEEYTPSDELIEAAEEEVEICEETLFR